MILINAIKIHLDKILGQPPEEREISFYMDLLVSLASNPEMMRDQLSKMSITYEDTAEAIVDQADEIVLELLIKGERK